MKKTTKFLVPLILGLVILASIVWYLFIYDRAFTRDTLLSQARFHDTNGNSRMSSWFYDAAYDFSGHDENVAIELANQYRQDGNFTKAEYTLTNAIANNPSVDGYAALCRTYVAQDKLLDAVRLLDELPDNDIKQRLDALRPRAPTPDQAAGYYSQYMDLHLSSGDSTIYYTTDGVYPTTAGPVYNAAIPLDAGATTVSAIAVNSAGLVSTLSVLEYTITGVIEEVVFTDPVLETAIRTAIGADADRTIMTNELWEVTEFIVPDGVVFYDDIALMPNLEKLSLAPENLRSLNFEPKKVGSLSFLTSLKNLEDLDLSGCRFPSEDLAYLSALPALKTLALVKCGLSTIAGLENAIALYKLDLSENTLRNLTPLSSMVTLRELSLAHNTVTTTDLTALSGLAQLQTLDLSYNAVSDLAALTGCTSLTSLEAGHNKITDLSSIKDMTGLTHLGVGSNSLSSIFPLSDMIDLVSLDISSNTIVDISNLKAMTRLETFNFSSNQVAALPSWPTDAPLHTIDGSYNALTSLNPLKGMENLAHVYMDYNLLTNIDVLADCYRLVQVNVFGNKIPDVEKLREHDIIVNYDPTFGMENK